MSAERASYLVIVLLVAACLAALVSLRWTWMTAEETFPMEEAVFREAIARYDSDHDGRLSLVEWQAYGGDPQVFEAWDFNNDGYLDVSEFRAMFMQIDPKPGL